MNGSWLGYRDHFVEQMLSLRLSNFEKALFAALLLVLAVNVVDAVQRGDQTQTASVPVQELMALQSEAQR